MKFKPIVLACALACLAASCTKSAPPKKADDVAVTINGKAISTETFDTYATMVARRPAKELTPEQRSQVLDTFIAMQLAADHAEKTGLAKKDTVASQLALSRMDVLSKATFEKYLNEHPISDAEIKAEYDTQVAAAGREYRARHILVESRAAADDLLAQLNKGADFSKLAEKNSVDGSAKQGGDLGWFNLKTMVPQFSQAVATLEKGKYTSAPVQTQFGWHIIKLEDTRSSSPPAFDEVKDQVKGIIQRKKVQAYIEDLRKVAKIEKAATSKPDKPSSTTQDKPAETK
jgi:peptidyl-prolyl cis-trans isomerase C